MLKCYLAVPPLVMSPKSQHRKGEEPHTSCYPCSRWVSAAWIKRGEVGFCTGSKGVQKAAHAQQMKFGVQLHASVPVSCSETGAVLTACSHSKRNPEGFWGQKCSS